MENNKEQAVNPREHVYQQGTKVEVDGYVITDLIMIFETLLKDEIKTESKFKFNYVNEKGNIVKNTKKEDIESGKVKKMLDFNRTIMDPSFEYSITEKGVAYAELKNFLESLHYKNIQEGKTVHYKELTPNMVSEPVGEDK